MSIRFKRIFINVILFHHTALLTQDMCNKRKKICSQGKYVSLKYFRWVWDLLTRVNWNQFTLHFQFSTSFAIRHCKCRVHFHFYFCMEFINKKIKSQMKHKVFYLYFESRDKPGNCIMQIIIYSLKSELYPSVILLS